MFLDTATEDLNGNTHFVKGNISEFRQQTESEYISFLALLRCTT